MSNEPRWWEVSKWWRRRLGSGAQQAQAATKKDLAALRERCARVAETIQVPLSFGPNMQEGEWLARSADGPAIAKAIRELPLEETS